MTIENGPAILAAVEYWKWPVTIVVLMFILLWPKKRVK